MEGYDCNHYYVETATSHKNGTTSYSDKDEWVYEPYNMVIQESDMVNPGGKIAVRTVLSLPDGMSAKVLEKNKNKAVKIAEQMDDAFIVLGEVWRAVEVG